MLFTRLPSPDPYISNVIKFLVPWACRRLFSFLRGKSVEEAEEEEQRREDAAADSGDERSDAGGHLHFSSVKGSKAGSGSDAGDSDGSAERRAEDRWAMLSRRLRAAAGLLSVYVAWACFAYFTFVYGMVSASAHGSEPPPALTPFFCPFSPRSYTAR